MTPRTMTREQILDSHHQDARPRAEIELDIVDALITRAAENGYTIDVHESEYDGDDVSAGSISCSVASDGT